MSEKKIVSRSQVLQLAGMLAQNMPAEMSVEIVQDWIEEPGALQKFLAGLQNSPWHLSEIKKCVLSVTIYPERTVEEWVKANKRGSRYHFTTAAFGKSLTVKGKEPYEAEVVIFRPAYWSMVDDSTVAGVRNACSAPTKKIITRIRPRLGLKPVGFEHIAAIACQYPSAPFEMGRLVDLDSIWYSRELEKSYVPCLSSREFDNKEDDELFHMEEVWDNKQWPCNTWFLGLKE